jgi:phospholipid-binding lipoprotein MlaA
MDQQHAVVAEDDMMLDANDVDEAFADDEFDPFEIELDKQVAKVADPLEPINRVTHQFNDGLYLRLLEPGGRTYNRVTPRTVRMGIRNFFRNVTTPIRLANCLLQGKGKAAGMEFQRFVVNTMTGIVGFADTAREGLGPPPDEEDLGQTLAVYGFGNGFYIVLPFFGPSTLRDSAGAIGDQFANPTRYARPWQVSYGASVVRVANERSFHVGEYEAFKSAAFEPYIAMRDAYVQYRNRKVQE